MSVIGNNIISGSGDINVYTPDERPAAVYCDETANLTTTIVRKTVVGGGSFVEIGMFPTTGTATTAKFVFVCFNALSDSEEVALLANPSTRFCIPAGEVQKFVFEVTNPCTRYAMVSDAGAETAGSKTVQRIGSLI